MAAGLIACFLAAPGSVTLASALLPLSVFTAAFGATQGFKGRSAACVGINLVACGIAVFGIVNSPALQASGL
jgi:hypothetical protein